MLNPFITYVVNEQEAYASIICGDGSNNVVVAEMQNCGSYKSYFYYSGLFSDLSRNMTSSPGSNSSSDLIEDNNEDTEVQDEEVQDDVENNEDTQVQDEEVQDEEVQDDVENNAELNLQQDETATTELQENDDGNNANIQ
jgi:hypothetical protein